MKTMNAARSARLVLALLFTLTTIPGLNQTITAYADATTVTTSRTFPINLVVFVPCANGQSGEYVALSGSLHDLFSTTSNGNGGFRVHFLDNPQGVTGTGLTTGVKYQGTGVTLGDFILSPATGFTSTFVNNFLIIGQGPGNNLMMHDLFHFTVNPDGTVTSSHTNLSFICQ